MNQARSGSGTRTKGAAARDTTSANARDLAVTKAPRLRSGVLIPDAPAGEVGHSSITLSKGVGGSPRSKPTDTGTAMDVTKGTKKPRHQPNWVVWQGRPTVSLFSAICLIHNITPGRKYVAKLSELDDPRCKHFDGHLTTLKKFLPHDDRLWSVPPSDAKPTDRTEVSLRSFIDFVRDRMPFPGVTIPDEFWRLNPPSILAPTTIGTSGQPGQLDQPDQLPSPAPSISAAMPAASSSSSPVLAEPQTPKAPVAAEVGEKPSVKRRPPKPRPQVNRVVNLDQPGFLSLRDVLAILPVSKSTLYDGIDKGTYPESVKLGKGRRVGWRTADIKKLVDDLAK
jgi:predicted DNA-binding transcriptional regulator AlpA